VVTGGYLEEQYAQSRSMIDRQTTEFLGVTNYSYTDRVEYDMEQQSNLGFSLRLADYM